MRKIILVLALAGLIFSGYLSAVKLLTDTCALGESCPYFLGYPACWYGFGAYLVLTILAVLLVSNRGNEHLQLRLLLAVSGLGIIFAGYFAGVEIYRWFANGFILRYKMGLPTCAYGLIFYVAIFSLALRESRGESSRNLPPENP